MPELESKAILVILARDDGSDFSIKGKALMFSEKNIAAEFVALLNARTAVFLLVLASILVMRLFSGTAFIRVIKLFARHKLNKPSSVPK